MTWLEWVLVICALVFCGHGAPLIYAIPYWIYRYFVPEKSPEPEKIVWDEDNWVHWLKDTST